MRFKIPVPNSWMNSILKVLYIDKIFNQVYNTDIYIDTSQKLNRMKFKTKNGSDFDLTLKKVGSKKYKIESVDVKTPVGSFKYP